MNLGDPPGVGTAAAVSGPGSGSVRIPEDAPGAGGRGGRRAGSRRGAWALAVTALVVVAFLAYELPAYLGMEASRSRVPIRADWVLHYPLLWTHIMCGSIALVTACLQIWPWLRRRHPRVHRWAGRLYLFGGVLPAGVAVMGVAPVSSTGFSSQVGNTMLGVLWLVTAVAGFRAARARRFAEHRVWMVRSVALTFSIVANRAWLVLFLAATGGLADDADRATITTAAGASVWTSWVVNLVIAEWWVTRRPRRTRTGSATAVGGVAGQRSASATTVDARRGRGS